MIENETQPHQPIHKLKGAIVMISCAKYMTTRLSLCSLSKAEYAGWKVFIIVGDLNIINEYEIHQNVITLKCEDSYAHILKKLVLGCKIILQMYELEYGILRVADDLIFNEDKMKAFLITITQQHPHYMGVVAQYNGVGTKHIFPHYNNFMVDYFNDHTEDLNIPQNGIHYTIEEMQQFNIFPFCTYAGGVVIYLSVYSCYLLIEEMEKIGWDVFYNTEMGYPYLIEDIGIGYILANHNIELIPCKLYSNNKTDILDTPTGEVTFAYHTNMFK